MSSAVEIRNMQPADLQSVLEIQALSYTHIIPESKESFAAKLTASPASCFVALVERRVAGYLVALPWDFANPPLLDQTSCALPAQPDCLYLHDLAVTPAARELGAGRTLVEAFFSYLKQSQLKRASLIAIQNSSGYWQRHGFRPVAIAAALRARLSGYGADVQYMQFETIGAVSSPPAN